MTENANPKPFNIISRQKYQRRKLGITALLSLSTSQSMNRPYIEPFTVKLAEQNSNQRLSKM